MTSVDTTRATELPADRAAITTYLAEAYSEITQRPAPDPAAVLTLDSLQAVQLVGRVELDLGIDAPVDDMFGEFTLEELADQVAAVLQGDRRTPATVLQVDVANRHEPFPLTAIQQAYLLGRAGLFDLGDVSTHLYMEFEHTDLDLDRLTVALRRLIDRQGMLRAVVSDDGQQRILADVPPYEIVTTDLRGRTEQEAERQLAETRDRMSHQVIPADHWPLFEVRAHRMDDHRTRLHLSVDLLIADAASIALLLGEWSRLYQSPDAVVAPLEMSFRDYVLALEERRNSEQYATARDYWISRIPELPAAPELPYDPRSTDNRFVRRWRAIDRDTWTALQRRAADAGLTPSTLLCAAYADVLATWAKDPRFTINVTLGERLPLHHQVRDLIGDFTAVTLLAIDAAGSDDFTDRAGRLQSQLRQDMEHRVFSGVEVLREMARRSDATPRMPVVFTSMVGFGFDGTAQLFDTPSYAVSQTPQVLLDNQVLERNGRLEISWDAVDARFQPGVLDAMFDAYGDLLERLAAGDPPASPGALVPERDRRLWAAANDTAREPADGLLHQSIARWAGETPDAPAIVTTERTLSHAELDRVANQIAHRLRSLSVRPNELVGVVMEKGWEQVAAVLGILRSGAAYLPIDGALPGARIRHLLDRGEVRVVLTQSWVDDHTDWPTGVERLRIDEPANGIDDTPIDCPAGPGDLAYVIFTSGSTGEPKGVMIEHRAALNTVVDVNSRFEVGPADRTLALSSLSFDLSVYDIFGTLAAGGTIVIPDGDAGRDPVRWAELVRTHGVTIWNSVPALLGLLADAADGNRNAVGTSLRLAMLSGDWIPVELPGRFRALAPQADLVSLGGATEGSIWSIIYPITDIDPRWTSVPYGRAMVNQTMHVLGADHEPRPVWVPGEIHIGGVGVATGYWRDEDKTAERFVRHRHTGERLYRTGDLGRLLPDGNIEFLGREDFQVKIRGYRVELGEIEAVLAEHAGVRTVVVTAASDANGAKRLVAHYVPAPDSAISDADLRDHARNRLPEYMVPSVFVASAALPLTSNGKVDRGRLPAPPADCPARYAGTAIPGGRTEVEQTLAGVWREVLNTADVRPDDDFLGSGGDSLLALRLVARLGAAGITIRARDILAGATFGDLCELAGVVDVDEAVETVPPVTGAVPLTPNQLWFLDQEFADANHWNGMWPLIMVTERLDPVLLGAAVHRLFVHHDALRTRFHRTPDGWRATIEEPAAALPVPFSVVDLADVPDDAVSDAVDQTCERLQASLDLETGPVARITYLDLGPGRLPRLHVAAHWAAVDYYSSRILVEDLLTAYAQLQAGQDIKLPAKTMSVVEAGNALRAEAQTDVPEEVDYWLASERASAAEIPFDHQTGPNVQGSARRVLVTLGRAETTRLVKELPGQYGCEVREVILTALGRAFASWTGRESLVLDVEGHGREDVVHGDISRTVGRFSTLWPLLLHTPAGPPAEAIAAVTPQVRRPRDRGVWHGLLRYLRDDLELRQQLADIPPAQVGFNYWGQVDEYFNEIVRPSTESPGPHRGARGMRPRPIDVLGFVAGGELALVWSYSENLHRPETVGRLAEQTMTELRSLLGRTTETGSRALHVDEHRPMQFDDVWSLAGLAGMTDSTEEEAR